MTRPTCETCPYWAQIGDGWGTCRRNAPRLSLGSDGGGYPDHTGVDRAYWCGEHPEFPAYLEQKKKGQSDDPQ